MLSKQSVACLMHLVENELSQEYGISERSALRRVELGLLLRQLREMVPPGPIEVTLAEAAVLFPGAPRDAPDVYNVQR